MNDIVAANIRATRRSRGWTQDELAGRMRAAGVDWTRQIAGYAESGTRQITVNELLALAVVFDTTPGYWLAPLPESFGVSLKAGEVEVPGAWLIATAAAGDASPPLSGQQGPSPWGRLFETLARVVETEGMSSKNATLLHRTLARLRSVSRTDNGG